MLLSSLLRTHQSIIHAKSEGFSSCRIELLNNYRIGCSSMLLHCHACVVGKALTYLHLDLSNGKVCKKKKNADVSSKVFTLKSGSITSRCETDSPAVIETEWMETIYCKVDLLPMYYPIQRGFHNNPSLPNLKYKHINSTGPKNLACECFATCCSAAFQRSLSRIKTHSEAIFRLHSISFGQKISRLSHGQ